MTAKKPKNALKEKTTHVSKRKKETVSELVNLIKSKKTILLASIKGIPSSQYQEIIKKLRGKAIVKVPKKSIISRALDNSGIEEVKNLKKQIKDSMAILFSDSDAFDLAAELVSKKSPAKAKQGQEAISDIEIPEGPTDLIPGPAISELGALGIKIQIEKGKITIKEPKVIAKQGEKISRGAAEMMNKLGIRPFFVGFIPVAAFDSKERKIYLEINIDKEKTLSELKESFSKSLGFAVEIGYASSDTIGFLIGKAGMHENALNNLIKKHGGEEKNE
ncbi:MAG: 50S ribosomal protein L10 [Nanoarchaeota archaeon]